MAEKGSIFDVLRRPIGNLLLFLFKFDLAVALMFYTYILLVVPLHLWGVGTFGSQDTLWLLALFGGMFGLTLLAWRNASNRSGILFAITPLAFNWWLMDVFLVLGGVYNVLPLAGAFGLFSIVLTSIVFGLGIAVLIEKSVAKFRAGEGMRGSIATFRASARQQRRYAAICLG